MAKLSDKKRFWLAVFLMLSGVVLVYIAFFVPPVGEIHGSVLGFFGEVETAAGAILGIDLAVDRKIDKRLNKDNKE